MSKAAAHGICAPCVTDQHTLCRNRMCPFASVPATRARASWSVSREAVVDGREFDEGASSAEFLGCGAGRCGDRGQPVGELEQDVAVAFECSAFVIGEFKAFEHLLDTVFHREQLSRTGLLGQVERASGAGEAVWALDEEVVGAVAVAELVVLPRLFAAGRGAGGGAGGAVVTGARAAATGARVATIIDELAAFVTAAMPVARLVAVGAAPTIIKSVQPLLDAQPNTFYSNTRPGGATRPAHPTKPFRDDKDTVAEFDGEQAAQDVRDRLSNSGNTIRQGKNIAVAQGEIDGQFIPSREFESVSGKGSPPGTVEVPEKPTFNPRDESGDTYRPTDSEYKILEKLSARLTPDSKGVIDLYTENRPCDACASVIKQFEEKYPGVKLNVTYTNP